VCSVCTKEQPHRWIETEQNIVFVWSTGATVPKNGIIGDDIWRTTTMTVTRLIGAAGPPTSRSVCVVAIRLVNANWPSQPNVVGDFRHILAKQPRASSRPAQEASRKRNTVAHGSSYTVFAVRWTLLQWYSIDKHHWIVTSRTVHESVIMRTCNQRRCQLAGGGWSMPPPNVLPQRPASLRSHPLFCGNIMCITR